MTERKCNVPPITSREILYYDYLEPLELSNNEFANEIGLTEEDVNNIVDGTAPVTDIIVEKLSERFRTTIGMWKNLGKNVMIGRKII